jgi:catechol 2,3-dioxygenase-like lactoylglutathione lyase family enzyme
MKIIGLDHVALSVRDSAASLAFYEKLGGRKTFEFQMRDSDKMIFLVDLGGGAVLEFLPIGSDEKEQNARFAHICLNVEDVQKAFDTALAAGARARSEPRSFVQNGLRSVTNAFVFGPDDEVIEFFRVND